MPAISAKTRVVATLSALVVLGGVLVASLPRAKIVAAVNGVAWRGNDNACRGCDRACGGGCGGDCTCRSRDRSPAAPYELPQQPRRTVDVALPRGMMPAAWPDDVSPREARSFELTAFESGLATLVAQHVRLQI